MKIQYLIDVKKALADIPEDILEVIGFGTGFESEDVDMCIWEDDYIDKWNEYTKKYPQLDNIQEWISNIAIAKDIMKSDQDSEEFDWMDEPIASDQKFK